MPTQIRQLLGLRASDNGFSSAFKSSDHKSKVRALFRALLRETTYLPDARSRVWTKGQVISSFRDYTPDKNEKHAQLLTSRWDGKMYAARKALGQLRQANLGHMKPNQKVLNYTYARAGKRRHQIMTALTAGHPLADDIPLGQPPFNSQVMALLQAQIQDTPPSNVRTTPKSMDVIKYDRNAKTIWMKPRRETWHRKHITKGRAELLDGMQVPLPADEYEFLCSVATGQIKIAALPQIRNRAPGDFIADSLLQYRERDLGSHDHLLQRSIPSRFMRHRYIYIFSQLPLLTFDEHKQQWHVRWSHRVLQENTAKKITRR